LSIIIIFIYIFHFSHIYSVCSTNVPTTERE